MKPSSRESVFRNGEANLNPRSYSKVVDHSDEAARASEIAASGCWATAKNNSAKSAYIPAVSTTLDLSKVDVVGA